MPQPRNINDSLLIASTMMGVVSNRCRGNGPNYSDRLYKILAIVKTTLIYKYPRYQRTKVGEDWSTRYVTDLSMLE